jgi:uncharacterized protein (TIGR02246 family)
MALRVILPLAILTTFAGCTVSAPSEGDAAATKRAVFEKTTAAFHQALRTNDTDGLISHVAEDVVLMPPGEPAVRGKDAMRSWYTAFLSQYRTSSLTLADREVFLGDGWAVEMGTYEWGLTLTAGGSAPTDRGNYMQVWKPQADGQWRFAREIWNSSVPASPPASSPESPVAR